MICIKDRFNNNQKGFTLVELMATLGILALIVAIAVPAIGDLMSKSEDQAEIVDDDLIEKSAAVAYAGGLESTEVLKPLDDNVVVIYTLDHLNGTKYLDVDMTKFNGDDTVSLIDGYGTFIFDGTINY